MFKQRSRSTKEPQGANNLVGWVDQCGVESEAEVYDVSHCPSDTLCGLPLSSLKALWMTNGLMACSWESLWREERGRNPAVILLWCDSDSFAVGEE